MVYEPPKRLSESSGKDFRLYGIGSYSGFFRWVMASSLLSRSFFLFVSSLAIGMPYIANAEPHITQRISESFANRFTTTVPLKQCEYPRFWSHGSSTTQAVALRDARIPFVAIESQPLAPLLPSEHTNGLFHRITAYYAELGYDIPETLTVVASTSPNAFIRKGREVVLTTAMTREVTEVSEVAFILAHEVAHVALGHHVQGGISAEVAADSLALKVVTALGFNPCSGPSVLERLGSPSQLRLVSVTPRLQALQSQTSSFCG